MRNIKLTIQYDGTNYCGWQIQRKIQNLPNVASLRSLASGSRRDSKEVISFGTKSKIQKQSIQRVIEEKLEKILQEKVRVIGSGRTDAGVHALAQIGNFKTGSTLKPEKIRRALNSLLPQDINIISASEVGLNFHSQFGAKAKTYRYLILNSKNPNPFLIPYVHQVCFRLDISLMAQEIRCLKGKHNFKSFCASGSRLKDTVRTIKRIRLAIDKKIFSLLLPSDAGLIIVTIEADGFLYNMVRNIVGTLIDIGRGYLNKGDMKRILAATDRRLAGATALAKGLYLCEVKYS